MREIRWEVIQFIINLFSFKFLKLEEDGDYDESLLPEEGLEPGILPTEIRKLVQSRRQVRQLMKASDITADQLLQVNLKI